MTAFDDLALLRAFVCIVECGIISAGARRLKIPQPTLSRYLRVLEEKSGAESPNGDLPPKAVPFEDARKQQRIICKTNFRQVILY